MTHQWYNIKPCLKNPDTSGIEIWILMAKSMKRESSCDVKLHHSSMQSAGGLRTLVGYDIDLRFSVNISRVCVHTGQGRQRMFCTQRSANVHIELYSVCTKTCLPFLPFFWWLWGMGELLEFLPQGWEYWLNVTGPSGSMWTLANLCVQNILCLSWPNFL